MERAGQGLGIGVQQAEAAALRVLQGNVVGPAKADVAAGLEDADGGELGAHHARAAVSRAVVGDNDLYSRLAFRLPGVKGSEAGAQEAQGVIGDDGHG